MHKQQGTWDQLLNATQAKLGGGGPGERRKLAIALISPNADQPRKFFDAQALSELSHSIAVHGVLQPLLVRPHPADQSRYQLVAGERRWLAAQQAGLREVPAVIRELNDQEALELGLVENVLREDITPMEEARALRRLLDAFGYSYAQMGERLGKNKAYVDHRVRLLKMPGELQAALERAMADGDDGRVKRPFSPRHAGVISQLEDESARIALIEAVFAEGLSVAETQRRLKAPTVDLVQADETALLDDAPQNVDDSSLPATRANVSPRDEEPWGAASDVDWEDVEVDVEGLAIAKLLRRAQRGSGRLMASQLLAALQSDRRTLKGLMAGGGQASAGTHKVRQRL